MVLNNIFGKPITHGPLKEKRTAFKVNQFKFQKEGLT